MGFEFGDSEFGILFADWSTYLNFLVIIISLQELMVVLQQIHVVAALEVIFKFPYLLL